MNDREKNDEVTVEEGSAATNVDNAAHVSGELRAPVEIGEADEQASRDSRRIAEEQGFET